MIIKRGQTILDFTAQYAGKVDELFKVAIGNNTGITDFIAPGTELAVTPVALDVVKYFTGSQLDVISFLDDNTELGGIGYMQIGTNFIVS
jgi:hypothetical protein